MFGPFANPTNLSTLNTIDDDTTPYVMPDGLTLYYASAPLGSYDLVRATRTSTSAFSMDTSGTFAVVNTNSQEKFPVVSVDELTVYFASDRAGGQGARDIWKAVRTSKSDPFGVATLVPELNTTADDIPTWISDDGCRMYVSSTVAGSFDMYLATKPAN